VIECTTFFKFFIDLEFVVCLFCSNLSCAGIQTVREKSLLKLTTFGFCISRFNGRYELVKGMQSRGIPIDGIGFQTHISNSFLASIPSMERNLRRFTALDLDVHITELDVRACDKSSTCDAAALETQAAVYEGLLRMCLGIPRCKVFEMWGFTDRHTWITSFQNPTHKNEMPLPFDMDYATKPCFKSMLGVMMGCDLMNRWSCVKFF